MDDNANVIGEAEMNRIKSAFQRAAELAEHDPARRERPMEDIYYGDVPTFMELPLAKKPEHLDGADAVILGFPYEGITAKSPSLSAPPTVSRPKPGSVYWRMGADYAPEAIRRYSIYYSVNHNRGWYPEIDPDLVLLDHLSVKDYGDVDVVAEDTDETLERARKRVSDIVKTGALPIVLGGDHTVPIATLRAVLEGRQKKIGLIAFDSHMDLSQTEACWGSGQWSKTLELGKISPKNVALVGIRSNRNTMFEKHVAKELGIRVFTIDEVKQTGMADIVREAVQIAGEDTDGIYVSLDIDVMEPSAVPSQKAPEIWGLSVDEMMTALRVISRERLVGYDVCEMTPDYDIHGMGAQFCARTVVEILAGLAIRKRQGSA